MNQKFEAAMRDVAAESHTGKPTVRIMNGRGRTKRVIVLCSHGHLVDSIPLKEWAGSALAARMGCADHVVTCRGTI
jgi:hypothetical protein